MGIINILDTQSANMIAAGEVVDRPASAVKELLENAVDAGGKRISVEVRGGGILLIRVTDDGCGFHRDDLPLSLMRHATSKIKCGNDLDGVETLGFRGEALAAIASVSKLTVVSKRRDDTFGSRLVSGEDGVELYEEGCPGGTTVMAEQLFYNIPARRKFLKKDTSESAACGLVCEKIALSHPEVSISFTSENVLKFRTPGDGKLYSAIHAVYGAEAAKTFTELRCEYDDITVSGYISTPANPRGSRTMQDFFVNGRYVKNRTIQAALEEAYKSYMPPGKFPAAVLCIDLNPRLVDVNVHPAKTEIKFSDERAVFNAVYYTVKNTLEPAVPPKKAEKPAYEYKPAPVNPAGYEIFIPKTENGNAFGAKLAEQLIFNSPKTEKNSDPPAVAEVQEVITEKTEDYKIIGEAYNTYIFVQYGDRIAIIDKHAAHERLIYEELRGKKQTSVQELAIPLPVALTKSESAAVLENAGYLESCGFILEDFGGGTVAVRGVPAVISDTAEISALIQELAQSISEGNSLPFEERCDKALFTVACKAALRAGDKSTIAEAYELVMRITEKNLGYCPHGRPFIKNIAKKELGKYFDR